jgi:hypothetical protein
MTLPVDVGDKGTDIGIGKGGDGQRSAWASGGMLSEPGGAGKGTPSSGGSGGTPAGFDDAGKGTKTHGGTAGTPVASGTAGTSTRAEGGSGGTPIDTGTAGQGTKAQGGAGGRLIDVSPPHGGSGGLGSCSFLNAPQLTSDPPRRALTWRFEAASSGGAGGQAGAGDADSGCSEDPNGVETHCHGPALLRDNAGFSELVFGDGNKLVWDASGAKSWVSPPMIRAGGELVWADYIERLDAVCATCGSYSTRKLLIRDGEGGPVRFIAREGHRLDDLSAAELEDVFGVAATRTEICNSEWTHNCVAVKRVEFDHVLPGATISAASFTIVGAPKGTFAVFWTASEETTQLIPDCSPKPDEPGLARDNSFAASRISP